MITEKCVLILGAGASAPYGFPTAARLKQMICYNFEFMWENFIEEKYQTSITYSYINKQRQVAKNFVNDFRTFDHDSIDLFLDIYKDYSDIGKKAIYLTILEAEKNSRESGKIQDWYSALFGKMIGPPENYFKLSENNLTIITFNYDRSLEHYFYNIFDNFTKSISVKEKIDELKRINIFHVYGKLADLPWENENDNLDFGGNIWLNQLENKKNNIKTIFERKRNAVELSSIDKSILLADKIYFLGFGFAQENVDTLSLSTYIREDRLIYVSDFDNRLVRLKNQMRKLGIWRENYTNIIVGADCKGVIEDYLF